MGLDAMKMASKRFLRFHLGTLIFSLVLANAVFWVNFLPQELSNDEIPDVKIEVYSGRGDPSAQDFRAYRAYGWPFNTTLLLNGKSGTFNRGSEEGYVRGVSPGSYWERTCYNVVFGVAWVLVLSATFEYVFYRRRASSPSPPSARAGG